MAEQSKILKIRILHRLHNCSLHRVLSCKIRQDRPYKGGPQTVDKLRNPALLDEIHSSHVLEYAPRADFIRVLTFEVFNSLDFDAKAVSIALYSKFV